MSYAIPTNSSDVNANSSQPLPRFQSGEIVNELELVVIDIIETVLGDRFRYCPQVPLEVICDRTESDVRLPDKLWKFWVSSRVDIAIMERGYCASRQAKLVVECQSHWHDRLDAQIRDRQKSQLLAAAGVPLVYVRRVDVDKRFYCFYTPSGDNEVLYNAIAQTERTQLTTFLQQFF